MTKELPKEAPVVERYRVERGGEDWLVIHGPPSLQVMAICATEADANLIASALNDAPVLRAALGRIKDRAERIVVGDVETTCIGAADYDIQVASEALEASGRVPERGQK